jgi:hypothetical protein
MIPRKRLYLVLFSLLAAATEFTGGGQAKSIDHSPAFKNAKVAGKWRIAWDVRLGTVRGVLALKQTAAGLTGTFQEYGKTYPLSGSIQGPAITFEVPFPGPPHYTIEFKGTVERDKITGTSGLKGTGQAYLGHAGEVDEPQRPWTATRGLKRQNNAPGKPPDDDDDDDDRPRTPVAGKSKP